MIVETSEGPEVEEEESADLDVTLANEFASVRVRRLRTRNGVLLEISSRRLSTCIRLDPLALESLTWQTMETFTRFLRDPYGPSE